MKKIALSIFILCFIFVGAANAAMPGSVHTHTSEFDGTNEYTMTPGFVKTGKGMFGGQHIKLGLHRTSKMPEGEIVLTASIKGIKNITSGESLHFNIDGEFVGFTSNDVLTDRETVPGVQGIVKAQNWSNKRYVITQDLLKRLITAEKVLIKVSFGKEYIVGTFTTDKMSSAYRGFKKFYTLLTGEKLEAKEKNKPKQENKEKDLFDDLSENN